MRYLFSCVNFLEVNMLLYILRRSNSITLLIDEWAFPTNPQIRRVVMLSFNITSAESAQKTISILDEQTLPHLSLLDKWPKSQISLLSKEKKEAARHWRQKNLHEPIYDYLKYNKTNMISSIFFFWVKMMISLKTKKHIQIYHKPPLQNLNWVTRKPQ